MGQGQALSHPSVASPVAGIISHPSREPVRSFFSLWSQDSGFTDSLRKKNLGRADKAAPGLSPPTALAVLPRDGRLPLPGEPPLSPPAVILCALRTALPELPEGFSLPSPAPRRLCPSAPDSRTLATFQRFGLPGFLLTSGMASLRPQLLQPPAPPAFAAPRRQHRGFMITSLFDWFHQPVIISLPKLFHQCRQHRTFGICKDKCPERHLPVARPVPEGRASRPLSLSGAAGRVTLLRKPALSPCQGASRPLHAAGLL